MSKTRKLTTMSMLMALSVVLVLAIHIVIVPPLTYDPGDIPILVSGFLFGPVAGLIVTLITCVIQGITVSAADGPWGILMHFIATGTFVVVASVIYQRHKTLKSAVIGIVCGGLATLPIMISLNLVIMPLWRGMPVEAVKDMILPVILPFNAIKVAINGLITFLVYKPISKLAKAPSRKSKKENGNQV